MASRLAYARGSLHCVTPKLLGSGSPKIWFPEFRFWPIVRSFPFMSRPLRVLFLAAYFPKPGNPLIGTWALSQAQALARRDDLDVRVVSCNAYFPRFAGRLKKGVRAYSHCPPVHDWDGLRVQYPRWLVYPINPAFAGPYYSHPEPFLRLGWLSARRELERVAREFKPDVIFAHHTGANGYLALHLKRRLGVPYVITDHMFHEITDCEKMPARYETFARIMKRSSKMISVANRMERDVKRLFPFAETVTIHNGAQTPTPAQLSAPRPPELRGKRVILGASVLYASKGFPALVRAWSKIEARFPDAILRIVGDGVDRENVEAAIDELKLRERVQMVGALAHDALMQEMVWADIFALISLDDPFPTVILEALAAAKPLVWPDDSGVNDVLQDGVEGFVVPPHDVEKTAAALEKILSDDQLRARMSHAAAKLSREKLTWDANAAAMSAIFHQAARVKPNADTNH